MIELDMECSPASASHDLKRVDRLCHALENKDELMRQVRKHLRLRAPEPSRVKLPTLVDRFNHTRNVEKSSVKYLTTGRYVPPGCERDVTKEPNPFSRPEYEDVLKKLFLHTENRNQPAESCILQKHCMNPCTCKNQSTNDTKKCSLHLQRKRGSSKERVRGTSQVNEGRASVTDKCPRVNPISARLYVPDVPIPVSKTDIDSEYFNIARGRPVREIFNRHEFSSVQKTVFFKKLFAGFLEDEVKKRKEHHRLDMWDLKNISKELDRMEETQELFASESHAESVNIVTEQMIVSKIREKREEEWFRCKGYINVIKGSLYKKDDMLSSSMYCRDILLQLSPTKFRTEYEEEAQNYRAETKLLAQRAIALFTDYCRYNPDPEPDLFLNEVVHTFFKQLLTLGPPKIFFKSKWEIDLVFRKMELHCMEQIDDLQRMRRLETEIDGIAREVKKYYETQTDLVKQEIEASRISSEYETRRSIELEEEANLTINTTFKDVVAGDVLVETLSLIEVLHNYVLGPANSKFEGPEMMLQIEEELRNVEIHIQEMGRKQYHMYEKKVERKMKKSMKDALDAKEKDRKVRQTIRRVRNLYTRPPYGPGWRRVVPRSRPTIKKEESGQKVIVKKHVEKKAHTHLQLEGICDRDDVEADIDMFLNKFTVRRRRCSAEDFPTKSRSGLNSSLRSSLTTGSMDLAIQPLFRHDEDEVKSEKSLSIVQLGYDSEEDLLRKNYEKKKRRGDDISEPAVLYDIRSIDSQFMVSPRNKPTLKDRRHKHQPEQRARNHPLNWR